MTHHQLDGSRHGGVREHTLGRKAANTIGTHEPGPLSSITSVEPLDE